MMFDGGGARIEIAWQREGIAGAALYLSGCQSGFITGEVLRVNGGSLI